ncbi:hypothetical protein GGH95_003463, partial [Coemansia sp. RSA 1836]
MRFYTVFLAILASLLALCNATYVSISNTPLAQGYATKYTRYETLDTTCVTVGKMFGGTNNQVYVSGGPTMIYANDDCTDL